MKKIIIKKIFFMIIFFIFFIFGLNKLEANKKQNTINSGNNFNEQGPVIEYNPYITPAEAVILIRKNKDNPFFAILDIRSFEGYINGHIPGALNISYKLENYKQLIRDLDRDMTYIVYCNDGRSSKRTLEMMLKIGFRKVYVIKGGFLEWVNEGYSVEKQDFCCGKAK